MDAYGRRSSFKLSKSFMIALLPACVWLLGGVQPAQGQGIITEIIDTTGDGAGHGLSGPTGMAVDAAGNVYVTGLLSTNAFKITPGGVITQIIDATNDGSGPHGFLKPWLIASDAGGNVFVTGYGSDNAFKITPTGVITQVIDATGDGAAHVLSQPSGVAVDTVGNVYVVGESSQNTFKITPTGVITQIIGDNPFMRPANPWGIAVDAAENVYVGGLLGDSVFKIAPDGDIMRIINGTGDGAGHVLDAAEGVAVDAAGSVYVTGNLSDNAFKITPYGVISEIIDATGDGAGHVLDSPRGIAVDVAGNVYVTGHASNNAFRITPEGVITQIIDAAHVGRYLVGPIGIAVDGSGNVFVTGFFSDNVFKISSDCNGNGIPDATDIANGTSQDCNGNLSPDSCDIAAGILPDVDGNGVPDQCCNSPAPIFLEPGKSRYLSLTSIGTPGVRSAIRVTFGPNAFFPAIEGQSLWVGPPREYPEEDNTDPLRMFTGAGLSCEPHFQDWSTIDVLQVFGAEIVPRSKQTKSFYIVQLINEGCSDAFAVNFSPPLQTQTGILGDMVDPFFPIGSLQPDFSDIMGSVRKFLGDPAAPIKAAAKLQPNVVISASAVNERDIAYTIESFRGRSYVDIVRDAQPCTCPSLVTCGVTACPNDGQCVGGVCIDGFCRDACGRCLP